MVWCGVCGVAWCGVVWCGVVFFGSTLLQHRAREAAHAGERAAGLLHRAIGGASRAQRWRGPPLVPATAGEACIRDWAWWGHPPSHLSWRCVGSVFRTSIAMAGSLAGACIYSPFRLGWLLGADGAGPRLGGVKLAWSCTRSTFGRGARVHSAGISTRPGGGSAACARRRTLSASHRGCRWGRSVSGAYGASVL